MGKTLIIERSHTILNCYTNYKNCVIDINTIE